MDIILKKKVSSELETSQFAKNILQKINIDNEKVFLIGTLGAGKTYLAREMITHLGVQENIPSPSFNLMHHYEIVHPSLSRQIQIIHADLYRLNDPIQLEDLSIENDLVEPGMILIEWGESFPTLYQYATMTINIDIIAENLREITVKRINLPTAYQSK